MMAAALPVFESRRLEVLQSYEVLDTPEEAAFDELVQLASHICQVPIALVSLVDGKRQWFKSRLGLAAHETPRELAFCAHAILQPGQVLQVSDAQQDPRFADNPLVTDDPNIRFYAGMPLVTPDGHALGTLCVIDRTPRTLTPAQDNALRVLGRQVMALLTLRRTLAQQEREALRNRQLARAVEQSPVQVLMADADGNIAYVNPKLLELTGYSAEELMGRNPRVFQSGNKSKQEYKDLWQTLRSGRTWYGEFCNKKKSGELYWEQASISPLLDANKRITHYVAVKEDITERRRTQELLRAKNEELKGFAYTVSHDLKAPLRGITGYAQELVRKHQDGLSERARFCISQIITASTNLDQLIEDLLKYARLDSETPAVSEVKLDALVESLLRDRSFTLTEQKTELRVDVPPLRVYTWERGLQQVLSNLISNAIKYSRDSLPPRVSIKAEMIPGRCELQVSDNGIGFDMKYHDRIFGLFNRLVRPSEFEGTGAGLAIVKKVLEKMGGSVRAESVLGQGTTFYVEIPCGDQGPAT